MNCNDYLVMDTPFTKKMDLVYNEIKPEQDYIDFVKKVRATIISGVTDPKEIIRSCFSETAWYWVFPLNKYPLANIVFTRFARYAFDEIALSCLLPVMDHERLFHLDNGYAIYFPERISADLFMKYCDLDMLTSSFYDLGVNLMASRTVRNLVEENKLTGVVFHQRETR